MDSALEIKLIECLDALESGEALEQILARYPQDVSALRPALETAYALPRLQIEPSLAAKAASRDAFLSQADAMRQARPAHRPRALPRMLRTFATLALVLLISGTALVTLSAPALPGDVLYGIKRAVEEVRLSFASERAMLAEQLEQTRRDEVAALIDTGRRQEVEFSGMIESMQEDVWQVSSLTVRLNSNTQIDGDAQVGRSAHIRGLTGTNRIDALTIRIEGDDLPPPTTTPSPTPTPSPSPRDTPRATITVTRTPSPTQTMTPTVTSTPSPSSTSTPVVTITSSSTPTSAPPTQSPPSATPGDDGNENGDDDNGNENGNENSNDNDNENGNHNGNENENENRNGNENENDNHSGRGNSNDNDN